MVIQEKTDIAKEMPDGPIQLCTVILVYYFGEHQIKLALF